MKKNQLTDADLDEISMVDRGGNQFAKVVILKRDDTCKGEVCKAPAGIQFNIGFRSEGGSEIQSVVFDAEKWDEEKAKAWLKEHDMMHGKMDKTANTMRFRQMDPEEFDRFRMITPGAQVSKALKAKDSWSNTQHLVDSALRKRFQDDGPIFVRDMPEDSIIFEKDGKIYRADYEIEYDGAEPRVTFGEKIPQQVIYQDLSKQEKPPDVPAELLFKLGQLQARAGILNHRINKFSK